MSDCCSSPPEPRRSERRHCCPKNNKEYIEVPFRAVVHHIKEPWNAGLKSQRYFFCDDPTCDVVYFGADDTCIFKPMVRARIGAKETSQNTLVCYCFGVTKHEARSNRKIKTFIIEQTKNSLCSCETRNPSGRCCLKDFPE